MKRLFSFLLMAVVMLVACKKKESTTNELNYNYPTTPVISDNVPAVFQKITGAQDSIYIESTGTDSFVVIKCNGIPDHKSPYFQGTSYASTKYEAYNGSNTQWNQNPNKIAEVDYTFKIPLHPAVAATHSETPLGAMGVAVNGIPLFNQYAAQRAPLTNEVNSFDQYNGHPQQQGQYHYHKEPVYITTNKGSDALIGFLLDGFPVYGPKENGKTITNADLDAYHGHTAATADYPKGIYHYHVTDADPYMNGNGFYGMPGTVSVK